MVMVKCSILFVFEKRKQKRVESFAIKIMLVFQRRQMVAKGCVFIIKIGLLEKNTIQ